MRFFGRRREIENPPAQTPIVPTPPAADRLAAVVAQMPKVWAIPETAFLQRILAEVESCFVEQGAPQWMSDHIGAAARRPDDANLLHQAGYTLVDAGLGTVAIGVFAAAFALDPTRLDTPVELALALEGVDNYADAVRVLQHNPNVAMHHPAGAGLLACDAAMAGDLETLRKVFPLVPVEGPVPFLHTKAAGYVARADALGAVVSLDGAALRAWHSLLTGGVLLELFADGGDDMNGRFAAVWLQTGRMASTIRLLIDVLNRAGRRPGSVVSPPDRSSQIVGRAVATALGVPFGDDLTAGSPTLPTLVAAFDWASAIDAFDPTALRARRDLILFSYCMDWTRPVGLPPDVVGILAQACFAPWDERMRISNPDDVSTNERPNVEMVPPDSREPAVVAEEIVTAAIAGIDTTSEGSSDEVAAVREVCDALSTVSEHVGLFGGTRSQYVGPGPVPSNRFS